MARYAELVRSLLGTVTRAEGHLPAGTRQAILDRADGLVGGTTPAQAGPGTLGPDLSAHVDTVVRHAWRVTDEDVARLTRGGYSDDIIFEATVAAAVGAGTSRLRSALALLEGDR